VSTDRISEYLGQFSQTRTLMLEQLRRIIVGQAEVIDQILAAIFTRGHCLLVGVPGLAKTLMVSSISQILDVSFKRIQFTPDLMPSDITGTTVLEEQETGRREFRFVKGPIFANIILADEINRTPPKTQAALLQSMQERQVTVGQETYNLPDPFFVIATQNPIEQEGTYPLPEAQLDRFMFNIKVDYPTMEEERRILASTAKDEVVELTKVLSAKAIVNMQKLVRSVPVGDYVIDYALRLERATRPVDDTAPDFVKKMVDWGAGPRAGQFLIRAGQAFAAMDGRFSVAVDDIKKAAVPVLRHRVSTNFQAQAEGKSSEDIVGQLLEIVGDPEPPKYERRKRTASL
jgi:MoxR-like ATPase